MVAPVDDGDVLSPAAPDPVGAAVAREYDVVSRPRGEAVDAKSPMEAVAPRAAEDAVVAAAGADEVGADRASEHVGAAVPMKTRPTAGESREAASAAPPEFTARTITRTRCVKSARRSRYPATLAPVIARHTGRAR
jgi:hypothetical protein